MTSIVSHLPVSSIRTISTVAVVVASQIVDLPVELASAIMDEYEDRPMLSAMGEMSFAQWFEWRMRVVFLGNPANEYEDQRR